MKPDRPAVETGTEDEIDGKGQVSVDVWVLIVIYLPCIDTSFCG
jgi:hypothetical protein